MLEAAIQVLIEHGYEKSTTNRIADRAGYSVGTIYQYFDNREDIYGELIDLMLARLLIAAAECPRHSTLAETLKTLIARFLSSVGEDPIAIQAFEGLLAGQFRDKRRAANTRLIASMVLLLEAHRDEIVVKDLRLAGTMIVGATAGLANGANLELLQSPDFPEQVLRLYVAYLTMEHQ